MLYSRHPRNRQSHIGILLHEIYPGMNTIAIDMRTGGTAMPLLALRLPACPSIFVKCSARAFEQKFHFFNPTPQSHGRSFAENLLVMIGRRESDDDDVDDEEE